MQPRSFAGRHGVLLQSANLAIDLTDDQRLRPAVSRSLTRPSLAAPQAVRAALGPFDGPDGVRMACAAWLVTAGN